MPTERADRKAPGKDATPKWTLVIPNKFVKLVIITIFGGMESEYIIVTLFFR